MAIGCAGICIERLGVTVIACSLFHLSGWRRLGVALVLCLLPLGAATAAASFDNLRQGPKVGAKIPHTLAAPDQKGVKQDFRSLRRKRGLILLFTRSLDW